MINLYWVFGELKKCLLIGCIIGLLPFFSYGQRYNINSFSVNKGLPHSQISDVVQTNDGFVWIGTYGGGVTRFDGKNFKNYSMNEGLATNATEIVYEDSKGDLWVGTHGYGPMRLEADSMVSAFKGSVLDTTTVLKIGEPRQEGEVWFGTSEAGVFVYDGDEIKQYTTADGLISNTVWDFWESPKGITWLATQGGISKFDGEKFDNITQDQGLSDDRVFEFAQAPNGQLWIATGKGITLWNGQHFTTIKEINNIKLGTIFDLLVSSDGSLWIATDKDGIFKYQGETFFQITTQNGLSSNKIYELYEDSYQNIWIGTYDNGLDLYTGNFAKFYGKQVGLNSQKITSIHFDSQNRKWIGTFDGVYKKHGDSFKSPPFSKQIEQQGQVREIAEFENGNLLFLMSNHVIYEYNGQRYQNYSKKHNLTSLIIYELYVDNDNTLWIGSDKGIFHITDEQVEQFTRDDGLPSNAVKQIFEHKGDIWLATQGGVSQFDGVTFTNYTEKDGLNHQAVRYIITDKEENLWVGTSGGVSYLQLDNNGGVQSIQNIKKSDGLKLTKTQMLWFDGSGDLWQGTNGGLHKIDIPEFHNSGNIYIEHYRLSDVGIGIETNHKAIQKISPYKVWLGTMDGVLELDTKTLDRKQEEVPVYITAIDRNASSILKSGRENTVGYRYGRPIFQKLEFPYGQDTYTFNFLSPTFGSNTDITYRYKLQGFEDTWSQPSEIKQATFTNLDPGTYTFRVQVSIGTGRLAVDEATVQLVIQKPFWQTYWFYAVVFLTLVGVVYTYIQFRVHKVEKDRLKELVDEQTQDLTEALQEKEVLIKEIHHRVKNNLAVISGLLELQIGYADNEFVSRVLSESQRRVQSISMIHEKLYQNERLAEIEVEKYVKELIDVISYSFGNPKKNITVEIDIDEFKLGVNQGIPCGLILNELISNAYEHAFNDQSKGVIYVDVNEDKKQTITLLVEDNGSGIKDEIETAQSETLGLTLVETLCEQLNGDWLLENTKKGTRFTLQFKREEAPLNVPIGKKEQ